MRKKISAILIMAVLVMTTLTGCMSIDVGIDTTKPGKKFSMTATVLFDKAAVDNFSEESVKEMVGEEAGSEFTAMGTASVDGIKQMPVVVIDGKEYYQQKETSKEAYTVDKKLDSSGIIRKDSFYVGSGLDSLDMGDDTEDMTQFANMGIIDKISFTVKFNKKIKKTNGKLAPNKKSVTFSYNFKDLLKKQNSKKAEMYAYTEGAKSSLDDDRELVKEYEKKQKEKEKNKKK